MLAWCKKIFHKIFKKKSNKLHAEWLLIPFKFEANYLEPSRHGPKSVLLCTLASLTSLQGCTSFGAHLGNNGDVANACVDRDLGNGDSCSPVWVPAKPEQGPSPETREE
jgi:hypothetical protein